MHPICPTDYSCTFTLVHAHVVYHTVGPWYQHTAGWIVALVAVLTIACLLAYMANLVSGAKQENRARSERELERQHKLAIEEQRTMQADMAKGNPDMLKLIQAK